VACDIVLKRLLPPVYQATKYGWTVAENTTENRILEDSPGEFRNIRIEHFKNGFKRWGDIDTKKTKMLIIGDSFTDMEYVSNGEEWYSYLENEFTNLELFVYGGGGYGSLQEFMVLDDFIDIIHPQLILIQFCHNDYVNNLYDWDISTYPNNNYGVRPYWENGQIVYRLPLPLANLRKHSFVADRILVIYDKFVSDRLRKNYRAYLEKIQREASNASQAEKKRLVVLERRAFAVTNRIYAMISKRAVGVPVYIFNYGDDPGIEEICLANNLKCISGISKELELKEKEGLHIKVEDQHWNKLGNQIVGQKIVEYFKNIESFSSIR
jgi:hypothetical protein